MPVLSRRRHEGSEPVEELKWGKLNDAAGARPCGLPPASRADPVGHLVSGEHVADAGDAAVFAADHGEPLQREGRPGTVSQQVLETLEIARHVAVDERDPDADVNRKTTVLSSEHVGGHVSVEEPLHAEPAHDPASHAFGEGCEVRGRDRPCREKLCGVAVRTLREHAVGHARMEVDVAIHRRSEPVKEGDGARAWPRSRRDIIST
jgi:hypothetical protein